MTCRIKCDVEINVSGPTDQTVVKWTADALRLTADRLERDEFEDGHHTATDRSGPLVGTVYFDFYAEDDQLLGALSEAYGGLATSGNSEQDSCLL